MSVATLLFRGKEWKGGLFVYDTLLAVCDVCSECRNGRDLDRDLDRDVSVPGPVPERTIGRVPVPILERTIGRVSFLHI